MKKIHVLALNVFWRGSNDFGQPQPGIALAGYSSIQIVNVEVLKGVPAPGCFHLRTGSKLSRAHPKRFLVAPALREGISERHCRGCRGQE